MVYPTASRLAFGFDLVLRRLERTSPLTTRTQCALRALEPRAVLTEPGRTLLPDALGAVALVLDGWACHRAGSADKPGEIYAFVLPGDAIGALPGAGPSPPGAFTALTLTLSVDVAPLLVLDENGAQLYPDLVKALDGLRARTERLLLDHLERLGARNARGAISHLLLELYGRQAELGVTTGPRFPFPIERFCLGEAIGITDLHLGRLLSDLVKRGHLLRGPGWLCLPRARELAREANYRTMLPDA